MYVVTLEVVKQAVQVWMALRQLNGMLDICPCYDQNSELYKT